ncbi:MAG: hypothetical protein JWR69_1378 [Pedosphaera sp.]|nr:hypothetical protein [Pedosphaera sp.]
MKSESSLQILSPARGVGRLMSALILLLCLASPLRAHEPYLATNQVDGIALLAAPPAPGSGEEAADLEQARAVFKARTPAEEARAMHSANLSFFLFAPATGPTFLPAKLPKTEALLTNVRSELGRIINPTKDHWKRKRPYQVDETLTLGKPEPSYSYPSGHSTCGTVYGLIIAELFPEKREAILSISRDIGWDRVLIGKHFLTDVRAGRVLGQAIVRQLMANPAFAHDLAEAKAEVAAAERAN